MLALFGYAFVGGLCLGVVEVSIALHYELRRRKAERDRRQEEE